MCAIKNFTLTGQRKRHIEGKKKCVIGQAGEKSQNIGLYFTILMHKNADINVVSTALYRSWINDAITVYMK